MNAKRFSGVLFSWLAACGIAAGESHFCWQASALEPAGPAGQRKYAPDRKVDIVHLFLDVTPDFARRTISASSTIRFKPIAKPLKELLLDSVNLEILEVTSTTPIQAHHVANDQLVVTFEDPLPPDHDTSVTVRYRAQPTRGLYFRTPEMGYEPGDTHLWTQGEPNEARHWYPCHDYPNEKFTSEIVCHVPEGMLVLSNGRKVSEERDAQSGLLAVRWLQEKPHVNYLISLIAGHFESIEDQYRDIPLAFFTPPSQIDHATNSFKDTKDMMEFFEREIGVPYPWSKYYQVAVDDFNWGGMENTSITTLNDRTLHPAASEPLRSSQGLVAHELAHQWFGNLVTCKDWSHIWLNEGFATYYDLLYDAHKNGRDTMLYRLYESAKGIASHTDETRSMVYRSYDRPEEQFSYLAYPKGAWVLHMLRSQLGEELFRRCVQTYLERHQFGTVVTEDLNAVIEELSGRSYDRFFDQWVYHARQPELQISYNWDEKAKLAKISVKQVQKITTNVMLFQFPLTFRFKTKDWTANHAVTVNGQAEDFYVPLTGAPEIVRIDPELTLLAKIDFSPPNAMLYAQLEDQSDAVGRLIAAEQLGKKKGHDTIGRLEKALKTDPFYAVRMAASQALRAIHAGEAFKALTNSMEQPDARARHQVVSDIAGFYREETLGQLRQTIARESNPEIQAKALSALGAYSRPDTGELLLQYLRTESYRNAFADAAIAAMRAQADPAYIEPLREHLQKHEKDFTSAGFGRGLSALAFLARNQDDKSAVREFLLGHVNHQKERVQVAAIAALGELEDAGTIAVLETFASSGKETPQQSAAEKALNAIRDARKPAPELGQLRKEVLALQKENQSLRKDFDELKSKLEAMSKTSEASKPAPDKAKPKKKARAAAR